LALVPCPHLNGVVELTDERESHITVQHPDLLPEHRARLIQTVSEPDLVRASERVGGGRLFSRWFPELRGGKYVVVVVLTDPVVTRHWVVTAYISRRISEGVVEWQRS
jgi:hypothetical protein